MSPDNYPPNSNPPESMQPVTKVCWVCNKETTGPYFEADGTVICLECRQKMKTGKGEKRSLGLWKGIAIGGAVLFLLASGLAYFAVSRLRSRPQPPPVPSASNLPASSPVSAQENPVPSLDNPTPQDMTAAGEVVQTPESTPTSAGTEGITPTVIGLPSPPVAPQAAIPSLSPIPDWPVSRIPTQAFPSPSPLPTFGASFSVPNAMQGLSQPVPNALATVTPLPNSLEKSPLP